MKHINLRVTHRLLFRVISVKAIISLIIGFGILFLPGAFFASSGYATLGQVLPAAAWGIGWIIAGLTAFVGLYKLPYVFVRAGLALMVALYGTWGLGLLTNQVINIQPYALLAVFVYFGSASVCGFLLLEPPINPVTAVSARHERHK